jgi:nucleoside-diphosphate-sugar epimerase
MTSTGRVLVTGASGRIGRVLVERARRAGIDVVIPRVGGARVALEDGAKVREAVVMAQPEAIVHLAAVTGAACERDVDRAVSVNEVATRHLVAAAEDAGVETFVLASTAAVYGEQGPVALAEEAELLGTSVYARTKIAAERILRASALPGAVSLRIFNVWGPGFDASLVARLERSREDAPVVLRGWEHFVRDYVHVDDVVDAFLLAIRTPPRPSGPVNVGTGVPMSNADLVACLRGSRPDYRVEPAEPSHSVASIARAAELWGFAPSRRVGGSA